jgi:hypothetical protein
MGILRRDNEWGAVTAPPPVVYSSRHQLTPHAPQHIPKSPPRTPPTPAPTRTPCPPTPRTKPTPHQRPIHPRTPRHAPLPTVTTPTRLLPQPKTALHPTKPHLPTLPPLQHQHLQRHRQLPPARAVRHRVNPKRHRLARLAPLGALVMSAHNNHKKHPLAPPHPTTRTFNPHQQVQLTPPHRQRYPLPPRALLPLVLRCPHWVAIHPPTPST